MELRVLRYFVEAAKEESMTSAALKLHVTQPTLSKQIKELEAELGQKLFVRGNYNIRLTPEGEILYKRALDILDMVDLTTLEFASKMCIRDSLNTTRVISQIMPCVSIWSLFTDCRTISKPAASPSW